MFDTNTESALNPHFIFNSMNAIRYTIFEDQEKASELLSELAQLLRYKLADGKAHTDVLEELTYVKQYLNLEALRLEERLISTVTFNNVSKHNPLSHSLLLPLVEKICHEKDIYSVQENTLTIACSEHDKCVTFTLELTQKPGIKPGEINFDTELNLIKSSVATTIAQTLTKNSYKMELTLNYDH